MKLSIIIVNYNTRKLLRQCLNSLLQVTSYKLQVEIIVVDNSSKDESVAMLKKEFPQVKLIENQKNLGFAKANNQGIKRAKGEYLLLLNSDSKIVNNALEEMVNFMDENPQAGILGPKLLNQDGSLQPSGGCFPSLCVIFRQSFFLDKIFPFNQLKMFKVSRSSFYEKTRELDWVSGSCFLVRKEVFDQIGLLDERFFMYIEEVEFCFRAKKAGWQVYFWPQVKVFHLGEGSGSREKAITRIYQGLIYFYEKHFSYWQLRILKVILKVGALVRIGAALIFNKRELKETYEKAFQLACHVKF